jgi:hypothetical protein
MHDRNDFDITPNKARYDCGKIGRISRVPLMRPTRPVAGQSLSMCTVVTIRATTRQLHQDGDEQCSAYIINACGIQRMR